MSFIDFDLDDIPKIIYNLDPNKAHGHDVISIHIKYAVTLSATHFN